MTSEKYVPYLMTTSMRKIIGNLKDVDITRMEGRATKSTCNEVDNFTQVGLEIDERVNEEVILNWHGSPIWGNRLISLFESHTGMHDMSIDFLRLRVDSDEEIRDCLHGEWYDKGGRPVKIDKEYLPRDDYIYLNLKSKAPNFDIDDHDVKENKTWREHWNDINKCEVCDTILCEHGFKYRSLDLTKLESKEIIDNLPKKNRPEIKCHRTDISSWIYHNVLDGCGLTSPNGMKLKKLATGQEWIIEKV